ncbi:MAG: succinylglutamate desuccinylase/aspartoacylase family protein [Mogibacterium sp.]|nr:succinylglutamate desuccinylase/aspartoacylase family protein [Mogibacterium sp.]
MKKILLFEMRSLYRDSMRVYGYLFGADALCGEEDPEHPGVVRGFPQGCGKTIAVISGMRGNEFTQVFEASQLVSRLSLLESQGRITEGCTVLVIPVANPYSFNSEIRFWPTDDTDINRMFPGYDLGETTQRVAASLFDVLDGFEFGIHLTSHYISGNFLPHVSIQDTGWDYTTSAKAFGLSYVRFRKPTQYDTTTLNYNWQIWNTKAYSIYGGNDQTVDRDV